MTYNFF